MQLKEVYRFENRLVEKNGHLCWEMDRLWDNGGNFIDDHTLTVTMNRLRGKIEDEDHTYIKTVRGMGYIWTGRQR